MAMSRIAVVDPMSGGLALARALVRRGADVTAVVPPSDPWAASSRGVHGRVLDPGPEGAAWVDELVRLAGDGAVAVLPGTDRASSALTGARGRLPAGLACFERDGDAHRRLMSKDDAEAIATAAGVLQPWTATVRDEDDLRAALGDAPWPCVVKPVLSHAWRARFGEDRVLLVADAQQALRVAEEPLAAGLELLLCEYVPGGDDHVEEAIVVRAADGSYPVHFGVHKLRQFPVGFGATTLGVAAALPETTAIAHRVLDEAGFVGIAGVEAKRHAATGRRYFLEVNVRLPGQWGLGDAAGVDASARAVATLLGERLGPQPPLREGVRFWLPELDLRVVAGMVRREAPRRRLRRAVSLAASVRGSREVGLLDPADPGPGLARARVAARHAAARLRRR